MDDRCPDVLAGQRQCLVRLAAQLGVERGVVQRVGEFGRQAGLRQDGLEEGPDAARLIAARLPPGPKCSARSRSPTPVTPGNKSGRASEHGPSEYARSPIGTPAPPATPYWGTPAQCAAGRRSGHARRQAARSVVGLLVKQMSAPGAGDGFGDGTGVSVFPAAALDDALDPPAVRRAEHVVRVRAAQQVELAVL